MPIRICPRCKDKFTKKSTYDYHVYQRKKLCDIVEIGAVNNKNADIIEMVESPQNYSEDKISYSEDESFSAISNTDIKPKRIIVKPKIIINTNSANSADSAKNSANSAKNSANSAKNVKNAKVKKTYTCSHCKDTFTRKWNLKRHIEKQVCYNESDLNEIGKMKKDIEEQFEKKLEEEIKKIREEIKDSKSTTNVYVDNRGSTVNNNYFLVTFGKENIDEIDQNKILECMQGGFMSTLKLTEAVHFDPQKPENHNIYISNKKDQYIEIYQDGKWKSTMKDDIIEDLYNNKKDYIEDNMELFLDQLTKTQKDGLRRYLGTDENDLTIKNIKKEIKLLLYNNRNIPQKTKKTKKRKKKNISN
jgi:hypothetical protein